MQIHWMASAKISKSLIKPSGRKVLYSRRSQWPLGLRRRSAAPRFWDCEFESRQGAKMSVSCLCCVLAGRGLWNGQIAHPEQSYWMCVCVCNWAWSDETITLHTYCGYVERGQNKKDITLMGRRELTLRRLMSYIYGAPILDVSRSHTTTQHSR